MRGNTRRTAGRWGTFLAITGLLAGCSAGPEDDGASRTGRSPSATASPGSSGSPGAGTARSDTYFTPDPSLVPRTARAGQSLAAAVVFTPGDWGRGFTAQSPARSTEGTWAVLDDSCGWQREKLPAGVLASLSRYSVQQGTGGAGTVKVTAAATVHTTVVGADEQLSTTLEEVLRCPDQRPRDGERITGLQSAGTPFGARGQNYADDSVLEIGQYVQDDVAAQPYRWMVARLNTVVVAVSVTGTKDHTQDELNQLGGTALARMLERVQQRLKGK